MRLLLVLLLALLAAAPAGAAEDVRTASADDWEQLMSLRGAWRLRLGDDARWSRARLDVQGWEPIQVPGAWEDQGFFGYDGFAWYRVAFRLGREAARRAAREPVYLSLGRIDDTDEVWVNGHFVGSTGRMPGFYETAYFARRLYRVPVEYLNPDGINTIAVRVYDAELQGGILDGAIGLYVPTNPVPLAVDLAGPWRFRTGDDLRRARPDYDDTGWATLTVPARWEPQGYAEHDGYAWYRRAVEVTARQADTEMVLLLGRIDDVDEVFVNGRRVGGTGDVNGGRVQGNEWEQHRAYAIPEGLLRPGKGNVIAVRVFDSLFDGGIYAGAIGLMEAETYGRVTRGRGLWGRFAEFLSDLWPGG